MLWGGRGSLPALSLRRPDSCRPTAEAHFPSPGPSATHVFVFGADESVSFLSVCAAAFFSWLGLAGRRLPTPQSSAVLRGHQRAVLCGFSGTLSLLQVLGQGAQSEHGGERGWLGQIPLQA